MIAVNAALLGAAIGCDAEAADKWAPPLAEACGAFGIDTPRRLAAFFAQIGHESGSLRYVREVASGAAYEGRRDLGNVQPGDGRRFRGRGLLQITGRSNYSLARDRLRQQMDGVPDFEAAPEMVESPRWAALTAADWWSAHGCNTLADAGDIIGLSRLINRGSAMATMPANGEADRLARWQRARDALARFDDADASPEPQPAGEAPLAPPTDRKQSMGPFVIPAIVELAKAIPSLAGMFASTEVAQRNAKAAEVVMNAVMPAVQAATEQEAVAKVASDPAAAAAAHQAVQSVWYEIVEGGSGGYDGARKAEATFMAQPTPRPWLSPSMWAFGALVPLAYIIVLSVVGLVGTATWPAEVQASLASAVISLVIGGAAGYYWGASTSRSSQRPTQ